MSNRRTAKSTLAASFVMTLATAACTHGPTSATPTPDAGTGTGASSGEPDWQHQGESGPHPITVENKGCYIHVGNPPAPIKVNCPPERVQKRDDGTCWYMEDVTCPPDVTCNPPPPQQVECPQ
jgi:hypothetical protein